MADLFGTAGGLWTNKSNQDFAEEMASTQYQRMTADMKAAGLNPMAMGGGGSSAAAPGGQATNPVSSGSSALNAIAFKKGLAETKTAEANAEAAKSNSEVLTRENSAYKTALESEAGKAAATYKKYQGSGIGGWLGGAGAVAGMGHGSGWGGKASAKAQEWADNARYAFGDYRQRSSAK